MQGRPRLDRSSTCIFAFRPVAHYLWSRQMMTKEPGTSLRNRRTIPARPLIPIVYARRLFSARIEHLERRYLRSRHRSTDFSLRTLPEITRTSGTLIESAGKVGGVGIFRRLAIRVRRSREWQYRYRISKSAIYVRSLNANENREDSSLLAKSRRLVIRVCVPRVCLTVLKVNRKAIPRRNLPCNPRARATAWAP